MRAFTNTFNQIVKSGFLLFVLNTVLSQNVHGQETLIEAPGAFYNFSGAEFGQSFSVSQPALLSSFQMTIKTGSDVTEGTWGLYEDDLNGDPIATGDLQEVTGDNDNLQEIIVFPANTLIEANQTYILFITHSDGDFDYWTNNDNYADGVHIKPDHTENPVFDLSFKLLGSFDVNTAPTASNVSISGTMALGEELTGNYTFNDDDNDTESGSAFLWYRSNDDGGSGKTEIAGATSTTYTLTSDDLGKYISFEVTPSDGSDAGTAEESAITGPVYYERSSNNGIHLDGTNDYVTVSDHADFDFSNGLTAEAWIKPDVLKTAVIVSQFSDGERAFSLLLKGDGTLEASISRNGSSEDYFVTSGTVSASSWTHVAMTYDGNTLRVFINGTEDANNESVSGTIFDSDEDVTIGSRQLNLFFDGTIDEVRLWGLARSQGEISASMNCRVSAGYSDLIAYYDFNQGTTGGSNSGITSILDRSANGLNATPRSMGLNGSNSNFLVGTQEGNFEEVLCNNPPTASNLSITGTLETSQELTATYDFADADNDTEAGSSIQWYRSNDNAGAGKAAIDGATNATYTLTNADADKYISFAVTPNDGLEAGSEVESGYSGPIASVFVVGRIERQDPSDETVSAQSVTFRVSFLGNATNVTTDDFALNSTVGGTISSVSEVTASVYDVTVNNINNVDGTLELQIKGVDGASGSNDIQKATFGTGTKTISQTNTNDYLNQAKLGQTFTATTDNYLTAYTIYPKSGNHSFSGTADLNIYRGNELAGDVTLIASQTINVTNSTDAGGQTFILESPVPLTQGEVYSIVMENFSGSGSHALESSTSGNYNGGRVIFTGTSTGTHTDFDLKIDIYEGTAVAGDGLSADAPQTHENYIMEAVNAVPTASNVTFSGTLEVDEVLTGTYDYADAENDAESGTTFKWYRSDDASGTNKTAIVGATSSTYTLTLAEATKYISFEVTPNDGEDAGTAVESALQGPLPSYGPGVLSISRQEPSTETTGSTTVVFRVTFSDDVTNVDASDFVLNSTVNGAISKVELISSSTYDVTVSDLDNAVGTVSLGIKGVDGEDGSNDIATFTTNESLETNYNGSGDYLNQASIGQTFTAATSGRLSKITIYPKSGDHSFSGTATLSIYNGDQTNGGTLILSQTVSITNSTDAGGQSFAIPALPQLTQGNTYSFLFSGFSGSGSHAIVASTNSGFANGHVIFTGMNNTSHLTDLDLAFQVYESAVTTVEGLASTAPVTSESYTKEEFVRPPYGDWPGAFVLEGGSGAFDDGDNHAGLNVSIPDANDKRLPGFAPGDLDADGDMDILVGSFSGKVYPMRNTGTSTAPNWEFVTGWIPTIDTLDTKVGSGTEAARPVLVDIDDDGDLDLFIGNQTGWDADEAAQLSVSAAAMNDVVFFRNIGDIGNPVFEFQQIEGLFADPDNGTEWFHTNYGSFASPSFADLDGDDDFDMIVMGNDTISYAENIGTKEVPQFLRKYREDSPFEDFSPVTNRSKSTLSEPNFADIDNDGDLDLISGTTDGVFQVILNTGTANAPEFLNDNRSSNYLPDVLKTFDVGQHSLGRLADLNGDGVLDFVVSSLGSNDIGDLGWFSGVRNDPTMVSAVKTNNTTITITYSENVQTNGGNPTDFVVTDCLGNNYTVSAQADGTAGDTDIVLTVASLESVSGDITITYTNTNGEISDLNNVQQKTDDTGVVIAASDVVAPTMVSATRDSNTEITITFSENIYPLGSNPTDFTVTDDDNNTFAVSAISDVTQGDDQLLLTVANVSTASGDLTITYTNNNNEVKDLACNPLATDATGVEISQPDMIYTVSRQTPADEDTNAGVLTFRVDFGEEVRNVDITDFLLDGTAAEDGTILLVEAVTVGAEESRYYDVEVIGLADANGTISLGVKGTNGLTGSNNILNDNLVADVDQTANEGLTNAGTPAAQSFQPTQNGDLAAVKIKLNSESQYTGDMTLKIREGDGTGGNVIATQDFTAVAGTTASSITITFDNPVTVTAGQSYTFHFDHANAGQFVPEGSNSNPYANGRMYGEFPGSSYDWTFTTYTTSGASYGVATSGNTIESYSLDNVAPTVMITSDANDPQSGAFTATFTFSEDVTGFASDDIDVGNGAASNFNATSASVYTATITPASEGAVTVDVAADKSTDAAGNDNTAANQLSVTNDQSAPAVTITSDAGDPQSGAFTATFTFSEDVSGFIVSDIAVGNGAASNFNTTSASVYTATITPSANGAVTVDVNAGAAQDNAGNDNTAATQLSITNDETAPSRNSGAIVGRTYGLDQDMDITVEFDEVVSVETSGGTPFIEIAMGGQTRSAAYLSGSGTTTLTFRYTTVSGDFDGNGVGLSAIQLNGGEITDAAGNDATLTGTFTGAADVRVDTVIPSLTITSNSNQTSGAFTTTFTFSEDVTGFTVDDISVGNGEAGNFSTTSASVYTATITPSTEGSITVDVGADAAEDAGGSGNTVASQLSVTNDETAPGAPVIAGISTDAGNSDSDNLTNDQTLEINGTAEPDALVEVFIGGNSIGTTNANVSGNWTFDHTGSTLAAATHSFTAKATDAAGNVSGLSEALEVSIDITAPGRESGSIVGKTYGLGQNMDITVEFDEVVFVETSGGIPAIDIIMGGETRAAAYLSGSGTTTLTFRYTTVSGDIDGNGVSLSAIQLNGGTITDAAGNEATLTGTFTGAADVRVDTVIPSLNISSASNQTSGAFTATFNFSEDMTGFTVDDITVGNGEASNFNTTSASIYTATITPDADGTVTVDVAADAAEDAGGNGNTVASQLSVTNDETAPTLVSATKDSETQITLTFSEDVEINGADASNFTVEDGNNSGFCVLSLTDGTAEDNKLVLGFDDLGNAVGRITITYDPSSGNVSDFAGNNMVADATGVEILLDVTAPSGYSVSLDDDLINATEATNATFTFADAEVGATYNYTISSENGGTEVTGSGTIATATDQITLADLSGLNDGELTLSVKLTDLASNEGVAVTDNTNMDATVPTAPTVGAVDSDAGESNSDFITNDQSLVIGGLAEANSSVEVFIDNTSIGTTTTNAQGTYLLDNTGTDLSEGNYSITAKATDAAGNTSTASTAQDLYIDLTVPTVTITSSADPANGAFTATFTFSEDVSGFVAEDITLSNGTASNFSTVSAKIYTATITPSADGEVIVDVLANKAIDAAGNANTAATQLNVTNDETAPEAPIVASISTDAGTSATDGITNDQTLEISGTAEANASVEVFIGGNSIGNTNADGSGDWTFDHTGSTLTEGTHNITAKAMDAAGNVSVASSELEITIDTTTPSRNSGSIVGKTYGLGQSMDITVVFNESVTVETGGGTPSINIAMGGQTRSAAYLSGSGTTTLTFRYTTVSGDFDGNGVSLSTINLNGGTIKDTAGNDATLTGTFTGAADVRVDTVIPSLSITSSASPTSGAFTATFTFSEDVTDFTVVDISVGNGAASNFSTTSASIYTATITPAAEGTVTVNVDSDAAQDVGGNGNTAATQLSVTNDETAPSAPIVASISTDAGTSATDGITNDQTLEMSGTAEANASVEVFIGGNSIGNTTADGSGDWTFDHTGSTLTEATHSITAKATDAAGNESAESSALNVEIDVTAPNAPVVTGISNDTGVSDSDGLTNDDGIEIHGTAEANASIEVFIDNTSVGTIDADANGDWTLDRSRSALAENTYSITAKATDLAGNESVASAAFSLRIDLTGPASAPTVGAVGDDNGSSNSDFITNDQTLVIGGNATANSRVEVFIDGTSIGIANTNAQTTWLFNHEGTTLPAGTYSITAKELDDAGNSSSASTAQSLVIDLIQPTVTITSNANDIHSGAFTATFTFSEDVSGFDVNDISVTNGTAGSFSTTSASVYTSKITPSADGQVTVGVAANKATDIAGNNNTAATSIDVTNDKTAPSLISITKESDTQITLTFSEVVVPGASGHSSITIYAGNNKSENAVSAADGTIGDNEIVLTFNSLSALLGDLQVLHTGGSTIADLAGNVYPLDGTGAKIDDTTAPTLVSATKDSETQITLTFSEEVQTTGTNPTDFTVVDDNNTPFVVQSIADGTAEDKELVLTVADLSSALLNLNITYTNNHSAVMDFGGNKLATDATGVNISLNALPTATGVDFSGTLTVGETLTGDYTYSDPDNDTEDGTTFKWYRSDDVNGTNKAAIANATSKTYVLTSADVDKYISFEVTPNDGINAGTGVESSLQGPINKISQTIAFGPITAKTYGDASFTLSATATSNLGVTYTSSNTNVASVSGNTVTIVGAGAATITASQAGDASYAAATNATQTLTVNKAVLTTTADDKSKTYGEVNPSFTISYTGFVNSEDEFAITTEPTASTTADATSDAGDYDIDLVGGVADNYNFNLISGTLTISKATLTATADDKSKTYGDSNPAFTIGYAGFVNGDDESAITTKPTASTVADATTGAGTYDIDLAGGVADNYNFSLTSGTLTIGKVTLTATAEDKSKTYGEANPAFTIGYTGFVNGDDESAITTKPTASTTADATSDVGTYDIDLAGGVADNYSFNLTSGTLTIGKATLTATADDKNKIYGETNPALTVTYTGFVNGEDESAITTKPTASTVADATTGVGTYDIDLVGGTADNYNFSLTSGTLTIGKATLTATAEDKSKTYGEVNPEFSISYSGFVNGDDETDITEPTVGTTANATSDAGIYDITLSGGSADNYSLLTVDGSLTIGKATLTATAEDKQRAFGQTNPEFTINYSGFVNGDNKSVIDTEPTASTTADATTSAGTVAIALSGGSDNNYNFNLVDGMLTIVDAAFVTSVSIPNDGTYRIGDEMSFTANFSGTVTITGTPTIDITIGSTTKTATFNSAVSSGNTAVFSYTVEEGDLDTDGITVGAAISLNDGSIIDGFGEDAILTLNSIESTANVNVDGVRATPILSSPIGDLTNRAFTVTVTYDEQVSGLTADDLIVTNGIADNVTVVTTGLVWSAEITPTADGVTTISVPAGAVVDIAGNTSVASAVSINTIFDGTAPEVSSITRAEADQIPTGTATRSFTVIFSEIVAGVDATDFEVELTGSATASVNTVVPVDAKTYTVILNGISGEGTVGLNAKADGSIIDAATNSLAAVFTGEVYTTNFAPTDISLSSSSIQENNDVGEEVATIGTTDADAGDSHTYVLVSGAGDTDNGSFSINGDRLMAAEAFDFETKASYSIRVKTDDGFGGTFEKELTIEITNEGEAIIEITGDGDFEQTTLGLSTTKTWTVTNSGDAATEVRIISSSQGFSFSPGSVQIGAGESEEISAVFSPSEAKVYSGVVVFNYDITDEMQDNVIEVNLSGEGVIVTGLDNGQISEEQINVFPNPATTYITIDLSELNGMPLDIQMINPTGVSKLEKEGYDQTELRIDVTNFENGMYIIQFSNKRSLVRKKVLVRK